MPPPRILNNPNFSVIDETDNYIVVDKPPHLLVHPTNPGNPPTLLDGLRNLLAYEIANGARLSIINRLDRETSGLVLVAKNHRTARAFSLAMQRRQVHKEYLAVVHGWPAWDAQTVDAALRRKGEVISSPIWVKQFIHPGGQPSRTTFTVLNRFERRSTGTPAGTARFALVKAVPQTGRMHQIRVHLAHTGHPIAGDKIYGPDETCYLEFIETGWTDALQQKLLLTHHALHSSGLQITAPGPDADTHPLWQAPLPPDLAEFTNTQSA